MKNAFRVVIDVENAKKEHIATVKYSPELGLYCGLLPDEEDNPDKYNFKTREEALEEIKRKLSVEILNEGDTSAKESRKSSK